MVVKYSQVLILIYGLFKNYFSFNTFLLIHSLKLNIILYLQYNTIEGLVGPKIGYGLCQPEEAHSHPVCKFFLFNLSFDVLFIWIINLLIILLY